MSDEQKRVHGSEGAGAEPQDAPWRTYLVLQLGAAGEASHGLPLYPHHPEVKPCRRFDVKCISTPSAASSNGPGQDLTGTSPSSSPSPIVSGEIG